MIAAAPFSKVLATKAPNKLSALRTEQMHRAMMLQISATKPPGGVAKTLPTNLEARVGSRKELTGGLDAGEAKTMSMDSYSLVLAQIATSESSLRSTCKTRTKLSRK